MYLQIYDLSLFSNLIMEILDGTKACKHVYQICGTIYNVSTSFKPLFKSCYKLYFHSGMCNVQAPEADLCFLDQM